MIYQQPYQLRQQLEDHQIHQPGKLRKHKLEFSMRKVSVFKFIFISFDLIKLTAATSTTAAAGGASNISAGGAAKKSAGGRRGAVATAATGVAAGIVEKSDSNPIYLLVI